MGQEEPTLFLFVRREEHILVDTRKMGLYLGGYNYFENRINVLFSDSVCAVNEENRIMRMFFFISLPKEKCLSSVKCGDICFFVISPVQAQ